MVLIGSWCLVAYREYFRQVGTMHAVRSRDIDFLVPPSYFLRKYAGFEV